MNWGSIANIYQSTPSYRTASGNTLNNGDGFAWPLEVVWKNPAQSIYLADSYSNPAADRFTTITAGAISSEGGPTFGTSHIHRMNMFGSAGHVRFFAKRHGSKDSVGSLFLDGRLEFLDTPQLYQFPEGDPNNIWDTQ
ncbi:MAG: hypothetical protein EXS29_05785 [Pedosphaera sp.]|nr:hypothetical protein [Pedosphaera sp.]MST00803.1 hypothetical protein [Pedosphaera sp.]